MKKNYYLFNPGRMSRKDNTFKFVATDKDGFVQKPKYLPVENIASLYIFGSIDTNSNLFNFLGKKQINVHFFDYYEHYRGSFQAKEYLLSGKIIVEQTKAYMNQKTRLHIASNLIDGAAHNIIQNLKYYNRRNKDLDFLINNIKVLKADVLDAKSISEIMGLEGNCRKQYYKSFEIILNGWKMGNRKIQPPSNEINAMISFGNMMCYTLCLDQIYHTQLNPTISFLHEPGFRRFSLALDLAEIFKPLLIDRVIFKLINKKIIAKNDFESKFNGCYLKESGRKKFIQHFEDKLRETIMHRKLKRKVSYKRLVRLEIYKISKFILKVEPKYEPFKIWW